MPLLDRINQISKYTMCTCCGKVVGLFSQLVFDIETELFLLQLSEENSVLASKLNSPSRLSSNYRNTAFELLEAGTRVADVPRSFGCNERTIYRLQTRFRQSGSKKDKHPSGRPRITTPLEVRIIATSA